MYLRKMGHGPSEPISGTKEEGYYGTVNGLMTVKEILDFTGIKYVQMQSGVKQEDDIVWHKYRTNGKTILVANKCLVLGFTYMDLCDRGFVTGRYIEIGDHSYVLRMPTGGRDGYFTDHLGGEWKNAVATFTPDNSQINYTNVYTICQEPTKDFRSGQCVLGFGYKSATYGGKSYAMDSTNTAYGWRPVLEVV